MARKQAILPLFLNVVDHLVEIDVGQAVAVVGEEHLLVLDVVAHRPQPLADVAPDAGVDQRDAPVLLAARRGARRSCRCSETTQSAKICGR